jgi:hypothetical protein
MVRGHFLLRFLSTSTKNTASKGGVAWGANWPEMVPEELGTPIVVRLPRTRSRTTSGIEKQKTDYISKQKPKKDE